jgi:FtsH-binding integral membrane protein
VGVKRAKHDVSLNLFNMAENILIPLIIFSSLFGIVYVIVTARNRERMAMIEKDMNPKDFIQQPRSNTYGILKWSLLLVGVGLGLFVGSMLETYSELAEVSAYFASALFFGGLGLLAAFLIQRKADQKA